DERQTKEAKIRCEARTASIEATGRGWQVWSAQQQKWYYEVAKGSLYATAIRCRECRQKRSAT
ncbi:MAG: zinc-ribbon domain containing protein, partial [Planctomycetales bacterium]|nr:zinc-ribbon domain containing protein [Planctomycetales bacterium]